MSWMPSTKTAKSRVLNVSLSCRRRTDRHPLLCCHRQRRRRRLTAANATTVTNHLHAARRHAAVNVRARRTDGARRCIRRTRICRTPTRRHLGPTRLNAYGGYNRSAIDKFTTDLGTKLDGTGVLINLTDPGWLLLLAWFLRETQLNPHFNFFSSICWSLLDKPIEHIFRHTLHARVRALRPGVSICGQNVARRQ